MTIFVIVAVVSVNAAKKRERAASNFVVSVTSKENDYKDSMYLAEKAKEYTVSVEDKLNENPNPPAMLGRIE